MLSRPGYPLTHVFIGTEFQKIWAGATVWLAPLAMAMIESTDHGKQLFETMAVDNPSLFIPLLLGISVIGDGLRHVT